MLQRQSRQHHHHPIGPPYISGNGDSGSALGGGGRPSTTPHFRSNSWNFGSGGDGVGGTNGDASGTHRRPWRPLRDAPLQMQYLVCFPSISGLPIVVLSLVLFSCKVTAGSRSAVSSPGGSVGRAAVWGGAHANGSDQNGSGRVRACRLRGVCRKRWGAWSGDDDTRKAADTLSTHYPERPDIGLRNLHRRPPLNRCVDVAC